MKKTKRTTSKNKKPSSTLSKTLSRKGKKMKTATQKVKRDAASALQKKIKTSSTYGQGRRKDIDPPASKSNGTITKNGASTPGTNGATSYTAPTFTSTSGKSFAELATAAEQLGIALDQTLGKNFEDAKRFVTLVNDVLRAKKAPVCLMVHHRTNPHVKPVPGAEVERVVKCDSGETERVEP